MWPTLSNERECQDICVCHQKKDVCFFWRRIRPGQLMPIIITPREDPARNWSQSIGRRVGPRHQRWKENRHFWWDCLEHLEPQRAGSAWIRTSCGIFQWVTQEILFACLSVYIGFLLTFNTHDHHASYLQSLVIIFHLSTLLFDQARVFQGPLKSVQCWKLRADETSLAEVGRLGEARSGGTQIQQSEWGVIKIK